MGINTNMPSGSQSLAPGQYNDAGTGVSSVKSNVDYTNSIYYKDESYWNRYYGANLAGGTIPETMDVYDEQTTAANSLIGSTYVEDGAIYQTIVNENGEVETVLVAKDGDTITLDMIDWEHIASTSNGVLSGDYLNGINKEYWGDNGTLTIQISDNGSILILENGVPMGWTNTLNINTDVPSGYLEFGKYLQNSDGSIDYVNARGETKHVDATDVFVDGNGNKFFISSYDENGNVDGVIQINDDYSLTGHTSKNGNSLADFFSDFESGDCFKTSDGTIIYNSGDNFKVADSGDMFTVNGETYFASRTDSNGNVVAVIKVGEDGVSGVIGENVDNLLGKNANDAVQTNDGTIIYNDGNGNFKTIDGSSMFEINGEKYLVSNTDEHGNVTGLIGYDSSTGKLNGYYSTTAEGIVNSIEDGTYIETQNGDILYGENGRTKMIDSSLVTIDENGNKVVPGEHGLDFVFNTEGNVTTQVSPIGESESVTETANTDTTSSATSSGDNNSSATSTSSNGSTVEEIDFSAQSNTEASLPKGFSQTKTDNGTATYYEGNLVGLNIDGNDYRYDSNSGSFVANKGDFTVTYNSDGSFASLSGNGYFVAQNEAGNFYNWNAPSAPVPSSIMSMCDNINVSGVSTTL